MGEQLTGNKLIAKNATVLYIRMFVTMAISFYTSRIVLQALGVSDYGIYNVVGGTIVLIDVLVAALGGATSRFLTFALGKKDLDNLKKTFSTAAWVHIGLAGIFVLVAETIGLWFINTQLVIPEGRMVAANWVYQATVVNFAMSITQTPYDASITSHEHMTVFAYIAVVIAICKLGIAAFLLVFSGDDLIMYSILIMVLAITFRIYYRYYCVKHFEECHITLRFDKPLFKEMITFSSWSMLGSISLTLKNQGVNILINRFFGTLLNAAAGVALQVQGLLYTFTKNIKAAFNPQIIKSYSVSNFQRVNELIGLGTKFTALVTILTTIPFIFNMDFLMSVWLKEVPSGAVVICQILLFANFFNSFNTFINSAIIASGKIKYLNISLCIFYVAVLLGTYIILKLTHSYEWAYILTLVSCPISTIVYIILLKRIMHTFSARVFLKKTYLPLFAIALVSLGLAAIIAKLISSPFISFFTIALLCTSFVIVTAYYFVFDQNVRDQVKVFVKSKIRKKKQ
ncbi:MAG: polysaccharide biosynthesis protein [Prevotella sp.]|nr:polysaccharide biosynthesis protein [Prevotella sp.]